MTASTRSPIEAYLHDLHDRFKDLETGTVADYIPELGKADPRSFGICVATIDGHVYEVGDTRLPFTIQSISKPFVYGLALEDRGKTAVLEKIGVEPTGDAFNEISLAPESGRPLNPMINAGAIASTSLVIGHSQADRWNRLLTLFSLYAGRGLQMNEAVYRSERDTGHRNRAISHMLRNFDIIEDDPEPSLDLYFRQCSIEVTARDLSLMAATLATCGMYDFAGKWVYSVGMPAKSGVAGGILAVLPGQLGIGVFSPPLDHHGNSVRGVEVCRAMSDELELHFLRAPRASLSVVRSRFTLRGIRSKRVRPENDSALLSQIGDRVAVFQLQGDLTFAGIEVATRRIFSESEFTHTIVFDLGRVFDIDPPASRILLDTLRTLKSERRTLAFVGLHKHQALQRFLLESLAEDSRNSLFQFEDLDRALEWCEDRLLEDRLEASNIGYEIPLSKHEMTDGLEEEEIEILTSLLERREFRTRELVVKKGASADELFLLVQGELSVLNDSPSGELQRLSTISPGMCFGELAMFERSIRTAFVKADRPAICWVLDRAALASLNSTNPRLMVKLLENLLRGACRVINRLSTDVVVHAR